MLVRARAVSSIREVVVMVLASWLCLAAVMLVTPGSHQLQGAEFLQGWSERQTCHVALGPPGQRRVSLMSTCPTGQAFPVSLH